MTARCRWVAATCLLLTPLPAAVAAEPRTDNFGGALPDGAVVRMGTVRCRHAGSVFFASFSPDGKTILSIGTDDVLRWWDAASGQERLSIGLAPAAVRLAAASPDRRVLAAQIGDDVVLLDAASGKEQIEGRKPAGPAARRRRLFAGPQAAGDVRRAHLAVGRGQRRTAARHGRLRPRPLHRRNLPAGRPDARFSRRRRGAAVVGRRNRQGRGRGAGPPPVRLLRGRLPRRQAAGERGRRLRAEALGPGKTGGIVQRGSPGAGPAGDLRRLLAGWQGAGGGAPGRRRLPVQRGRRHPAAALRGGTSGRRVHAGLFGERRPSRQRRHGLRRPPVGRRLREGRCARSRDRRVRCGRWSFHRTARPRPPPASTAASTCGTRPAARAARSWTSGTARRSTFSPSPRTAKP